MAVETYNIIDRFTGAVLFSAEIECAPDALPRVKLGLAIKFAVKSRADLSGANLSGANLNGANLNGANLSGHKIRIKIAQVCRDDGYEFIAFDTDIGVMVKAGCRWFSMPDFRAHVAAQYPDTPKAAETLAILDFIDIRAAALGCVAPEQVAA
jgi:uncharacterized protein YjbI with pentapeptide repeats